MSEFFSIQICRMKQINIFIFFLSRKNSHINCDVFALKTKAISIDKSAKCYYNIDLGRETSIGPNVRIDKDVHVGKLVHLIRDVSIASKVIVEKRTEINRFACVTNGTKIKQSSKIPAYVKVFTKKGNTDEYDTEKPPRGSRFVLKNDECVLEKM